MRWQAIVQVANLLTRTDPEVGLTAKSACWFSEIGMTFDVCIVSAAIQSSSGFAPGVSVFAFAHFVISNV